MTAMEIGKELVALCRQKKNLEAIDKFYSPTVESVEAEAIPQIGKVQRRRGHQGKEPAMV